MQFLADESCDFSVVRALRDSGHDVVAVAESLRGTSDEQVIELAQSAKRILITEDKDFGQLVFAAAKETSGVLFIRFPQATRNGLVPAIVDLLASHGESLFGCFAVIEPGRIRITRLP